MPFILRHLKKNVIHIYVIKTYSNFNKFIAIQILDKRINAT